MSFFILLYNLLSLLIGFAGLIIILVLFLKTRYRRLLPFFHTALFVGLIVVVLTLDYFNQGMHVFERLSSDQVNRAIQYCCCGVIFFLPRGVRITVDDDGKGFPEVFISGSAIVLVLVLMVKDFFFRDVAGLFTIVYCLVYAVLSLGILYFGVQTFYHRRRSSQSRQLRHFHAALSITGIGALAFLPFFFITDFYGYLLPFFRDHVVPGLTLLPAFNILMSVSMLLGSVLEIIEPVPELVPVVPNDGFITRYGLTRREAEIAPLVLRCMTYKEIGEQLFISPGTVRTHLIHIYAKTETKNRLELSALIQAERGAKVKA